MFIFSPENKFKRLVARQISRLFVILSLAGGMGNVLAQDSQLALRKELNRMDKIETEVSSGSRDMSNELRARRGHERHKLKMYKEHLSRFNFLYKDIGKRIDNKEFLNEEKASRLKHDILLFRKYFKKDIAEMLRDNADLYRFYDHSTKAWVYLAESGFSVKALGDLGRSSKKDEKDAFSKSAKHALKESSSIDATAEKSVRHMFSRATLSYESNEAVRDSEYKAFLGYIKKNPSKIYDVSGDKILVKTSIKSESMAQNAALTRTLGLYSQFLKSQGRDKGISNLFVVKGRSMKGPLKVIWIAFR